MPYESISTTVGVNYSISLSHSNLKVYAGSNPAGGHYLGKLKGHIENASLLNGPVNDRGEIEIRGIEEVRRVLEMANRDLTNMPYGDHLVIRKNKRKVVITAPVKRGREIGTRGVNLSRLLQGSPQREGLEVALV